MKPPNAIERSLIEKAAADNGMDQPTSFEGPWLGFASTRAPLRLWLGVDGPRWRVALSMRKVAQALVSESAATRVEVSRITLPSDARSALEVEDPTALHHLVRRAFQLSRALPDALLVTFERETKHLPRATEVERTVIQRVGQDIFRRGLLDYWEERCAVTSLALPVLLRASHIKPWADCGSDAERLDVYNGLLLAVHLDAAFDKGLITFDDDGTIRLSSILSERDQQALHLDDTLRVNLSVEHIPYLAWHQARIFQP